MLATVLVFLVVLTLTAFLAAGSTRTNMQLVNNGYNERKAFYYAEAGATEAEIRLNATASPVTVDGNSFDPSFTGANAPDVAQSSWQAQILFSGSAPQLNTATHTVTSPTLQPASSRLAYSTTTAGSADTLTIAWDTCSAVGTGCSAVGAIRKIGAKNVLKIVSTGQAGSARRRITKRMVLNYSSAVVLLPNVCPGVSTQGSGSVFFAGAVQVNSTCGTSISAGGSSAVSAGGSITVSGTGYQGSVSPTPSVGAAQAADPLATLPAPGFTGRPRIGLGTALVPATFQVSGTQTLQPGIYYGGISMASGAVATLQPGIYVMAGGGFHVTSNAQVTSGAGGVLIYNTCAVPPCSGASFASNDTIGISANRPVTLNARDSSDPTYAGMVLFQDRANSRAISITSGATGRIDGLIYAPAATLSLSGNASLLYSQLVVGAITLSGGPQIGAPTVWEPLGGNAGATLVSWQDF